MLIMTSLFLKISITHYQIILYRVYAIAELYDDRLYMFVTVAAAIPIKHEFLGMSHAERASEQTDYK